MKETIEVKLKKYRIILILYTLFLVFVVIGVFNLIGQLDKAEKEIDLYNDLLDEAHDNFDELEKHTKALLYLTYVSLYNAELACGNDFTILYSSDMLNWEPPVNEWLEYRGFSSPYTLEDLKETAKSAGYGG